MRVIYFHQHFTTPKMGGATRSYEFAQRLLQRGHKVTMVVGGSEGMLNLTKTNKKGVFRGDIDGIDVIQIALPYSNNDGLLQRTKVFVKFAWKSIYYAMNEDYDIAYSTTTPLTAGIPCIIAKLLRGKKYIFEVRDLWPELPKALGMKNPFALWGMGILEKISYRNACACVGLAPGICEGIAKKSQKNKEIVLIPNGCDLNLFLPGKRSDLNIEGVSPTDIVAVFTGAHGVANGLSAVLDAAKLLLENQRFDIKFVFVGEGKQKQMLIDRAKKENLTNCIFLDNMPKTQLTKIVCSADVGMQILANIPAFYYGTSPNKFFDYITAGRPVLNNYPGWLAEMIVENKCGVVVQPNNPHSFVEGLIYLADNPDEREKMGENSRILAEKEFSRDILGNRFVDFVENMYLKYVKK